MMFVFSQSLRKVGQDTTVLLICITVFLSYLPEAGQYSSFFLYLRQVRILGFIMNKCDESTFNVPILNQLSASIKL